MNTMTDEWDSEERFKNFMSDWNSLLYSGKQIDLNNWQVFQDKYNSIAKHSLEYITRTWNTSILGQLPLLELKATMLF
jgi:hypothetical protein